MSKKYTFIELIEEILKNAKYPMSSSEIWEYAVKNKLTDYLNSKGKTPNATLEARLYTNTERKSDTPKFIITSKRPARFWLKSREKELNDEIIYQDDNEDKNSAIDKQKFLEKDIHSLLTYLLYNNAPYIYTKTIRHEISSKKKAGANKWIHPDMVGVYFPFNDYKKEALELCKKMDLSYYKLYSFEIKKTLNFSNLRESYFQAVSNSSWANEGYLVSYDYDPEIIEELTRLNNAFGIGVIILKDDNLPYKVLLPAVSKNSIDIATIDLLIGENASFKDFISTVNKDIETNDSRRILLTSYDKILSDQEYEEHLKKFPE